MPTVEKACTYEGGTVGNPVSGSDTGNGDTPTPTAGAGATNRYSSTGAAHGAKACEIATGASAVQAFNVWPQTKQATVNEVVYVTTPASFSATPTIFRLRDAATQNLRGRWSSTGQLQLLDRTSSNPRSTVGTMSPSTAYRIEVSCTPGAASNAGAAVASFWPVIDDPSAAIANNTISTSGEDYGSTSGCSEFGVGQFASAANVPSWYHDDVRIGFGGALGPAAVAVTAAAAAASGVATNSVGTITAAAAGAASTGSATAGVAGVIPTGAGASATGAGGSALGAVVAAGIAAASSGVASPSSATLTVLAAAASSASLAALAAAGVVPRALAGPSSGVAADATAVVPTTSPTVQSVITTEARISDIQTAGSAPGIVTTGAQSLIEVS